MMDHNGVFVSDYERGVAFYRRLLGPFGFDQLVEIDPALSSPSEDDPGRDERYVLTDFLSGFGHPSLRRTATRKPPFWITQASGSVSPSLHSFTCPTRTLVDRFHEAGLAAGATSARAPGASGDRYVASVLDFDGNEIEAVVWETS